MRILFLFVVLSFIFCAQASANCFTDCLNASGCSAIGSDHGSFCEGTSTRCSTECRNENHKSYGAIAYSVPDEGYGYAQGQSNQNQAEKLAMKYCKQNGKKCKSMVWFYNRCGAVAADGKKTGWAHGDSVPEAQKSALEACKKNRGKNCQVKSSICSY